MKKTGIGICIVVCFIIAGMIFAMEQQNHSDEYAIREEMDRVEQALSAEFGEKLKKLTETEVAAAFRYGYRDGNEINYYILKTTFFGVDPAEVVGFHDDAFQILFDHAYALDSQELMIQQWPAMHYEMDQLSYLCWTYSPEVSYALEYDPSAFSREDIIKMAESAEPIE